MQFSDYLCFFPATGNRNYSSGAPVNRGIGGYYWSSSSNSANGGWYLDFYSTNATLNANNRTFGFAIRCVAQVS